MIPISNAYETEYLVRDHMREGLCEVERARLGRAMVRKTRREFLRGVVAGVSLVACLFVTIGYLWRAALYFWFRFL